MVDVSSPRKGEAEETFECQECGETKRIYELVTTSNLVNQVEA